MFSFHKPKIYRSNLGCCICKAKSSSSRFTDSQKYENEFEHCFRIKEKRSGEICNACVLLVKRWKKLSPDNRLIKHWHHVVDARAGPGTKLTGNRRLTASSSSSSSSTSSAQSSPQANMRRVSGLSTASSSSVSARQDNSTPLSSNQKVNQSNSSANASGGNTSGTGQTGRRINSSTYSKVKALDPNHATFTFGEPLHGRKNFLSNNIYTTPLSHNYSNSTFSLSATSYSSLNSGAFESVIKRFRQRQQQERIEAQKRSLHKQRRARQRLQQQQLQPAAATALSLAADEKSKEQVSIKNEQLHENASMSNDSITAKRLKRPSDSMSSITIDGLRGSSIHDPLAWRKERTCCGVVFRGAHNEGAGPKDQKTTCGEALNADDEMKLMRQQPSPLALVEDDDDMDEDEEFSSGSSSSGSRQLTSASAEQDADDDDEADDDDVIDDQLVSSPHPPPRTAKSDSISSCDSNTSGTGSMEPSLDEQKQLQLSRQRVSI